MVKRRIAVILFVICLCACFVPCYVHAASTADARESVDTERSCTLELSYVCDGTAFADVSVKLYKVASVSSDFKYTLSSSFAKSGLNLNGIRSVSEWDVIRSTLDARIIADKIEADFTAKTDVSGKASFGSLEPGLYLASAGTAKAADLQCRFDSALIALPNVNEDGSLQYDVSVASKGEIIPPDITFDEIQLKIIKLWKGDEGKNSRPNGIEVEIFRDGVSFDAVVLSDENNWSYAWHAEDDGAKWTVIERNIPTDYTMTVDDRGFTFVLTNTFEPDVPFDPPQTGDTSNKMLYVILLIISGSVLVILGFVGKRNANEAAE